MGKADNSVDAGNASTDSITLRIVSSLILVPVVIAAVHFGGRIFASVVAFASIVMIFEWTRMVERREFSAAFYVLAIAAAAAQFCRRFRILWDRPWYLRRWRRSKLSCGASEWSRRSLAGLCSGVHHSASGSAPLATVRRAEWKSAHLSPLCRGVGRRYWRLHIWQAGRRPQSQSAIVAGQNLGWYFRRGVGWRSCRRSCRTIFCRRRNRSVAFGRREPWRRFSARRHGRISL